MIRSIIVLTALTFLFSSNLSSQFRLDKIGASSSIDRLITTYGKESRGTLKSKISMRTSIGGRLNFVLPGRLGLTTGINLSHQTLNNELKSKVLQQVRTDSRKVLKKHHQTEIGLPIGLYIQTFVTSSCVTYLKLNANFKHRFYDNEVYQEETIQSNEFTRIDGSDQNFSSSGFEYSGADVDFSFGTYWRVDGIDAQICLEPRFRLYSYQKTNLSNIDGMTELYDDSSQIFSGMGFEVTVYKKLGRQYY